MQVIILLLLVVITLSQSPSERAQQLVKKMSYKELLSLVRGYGMVPYVGQTPAIDRLNIPALHLQDGPQGVADGVAHVTCFPSALTAAASWDIDIMYRYAQGLAREQRIKGTNIMLGPMVNIARVSYGGRNFESFGEDPCLSSKLAIAYVKGTQDQGVMATVKHWSMNNQEADRLMVTANVDERTQWEIYYPAFQAAVDAGVGAVMCAYNKINNTYACENDKSINQDLKGKMGFKGFVMSDWFATHSTVAAANSGLDMEQPLFLYFGEFLDLAVRRGAVHSTRLYDMVQRILTAMFAVGIMDNPQTGNITNIATSKESIQLAVDVAAAGTVLLKNSKGLLPLDPNKVRNIAVIGDAAHDVLLFSGGGSGGVLSSHVVSPLIGIRNRIQSANVTYANSTSDYMALINQADAVIIVIATYSEEGSDRKTLRFDDQSEALINSITKVQPNTVVVMHAPGAVVMPWLNSVNSLICSFYPGQEDGTALASILFGDINPSGKLPITFPATEEQTPLQTKIQYPGINWQTNYTEKLLVGYRWYDAMNATPSFPFGHGLSYTTFAYTNVQMGKNRTVSVDLKNIGIRDGAEVVQLYLSYPQHAGEPPQVLRDFKRVYLKVGQSTTVTFKSLTDQDLSIWDVTKSGWLLITGSWTARIGSSSRDIRQEIVFSL
jgi:beta-glucosidase